jgi:hypothetical protein
VDGLITALWLMLAPPGSEPVPAEPPPEPAQFDEVVDIASPGAPPSPEPAPIPEAPRPPPPDDYHPPPPPPPPDPQFGNSSELKIASDRRRRRPPREARQKRERRERREWKRVQTKAWGKEDEWRKWGAPLLGAFFPGMGQLANGHVLAGVGVLYGSLAGLAGSIVLYADRSDGTRPVGAEYARLTGFGILSTTTALLWLWSITDAARYGKDPYDDEIEPKLDHRLRVSLSRSMSVGFRADPDRPGFYEEWAVAMMGQVKPRWSVGISDMTLKPDNGRLGVVQFGARADYRMFDRKRIWIDVGFGMAMQVKLRQGRDPLDPNLPRVPSQTEFGAIPYGQFDFRWFVLDRVSLDLVPRMSVPLTTRYYSADRALPRFAPILELGASASIYF